MVDHHRYFSCVIPVEYCEQFAFCGATQVFQNYLQFPPSRHGGQQGALGLGQAVATALNQWYYFISYLTPILGGVVADQYLGKYKTIFYTSVVYMIGWSLLTLSSLPFSLNRGWGLPAFIFCTIIIAFGKGGIKSVVSPLAAEQFQHTKAVIRVIDGEKVIIDPDKSVQHLYNWFYWAINLGALCGGIVSPKLEQHVGYWAAFAGPTAMFAVGWVVFVVGTPWIKESEMPQGSLVKKAFECWWDGFKDEKWDSEFVVELKQTVMGLKGSLVSDGSGICYDVVLGSVWTSVY